MSVALAKAKWNNVSLQVNIENNFLSNSSQQSKSILGDTRVNEQPDLAVMHTIWVKFESKSYNFDFTYSLLLG